jgi:hypothetical protein
MKIFERFLSDPAPAMRRNRSRAGLLVSLLILPLLLGVMACFVLPVPIGDPEKSRIDPAMTGAWITDMDSDAWLLIFEPYDKRTWLVSWLFLEDAGHEVVAQATPETETETSHDAVESDEDDMTSEAVAEEDLSTMQRLLEGELELAGFGVYKGWLTKIRGERFMTWEPKLVLWTEQPMVPELWWITRVRGVAEHELTLDYINPEFEALEDVKTRSRAEKIIGKNIENPELFFEEDFPGVYEKISRDNYDVLHELLEDMNISTNLD